MRIVLIHGQNHKGSSYNIGRLIEKAVTCEKEVTEFFLPKDLNYFCCGCYGCINGDDNCPCYSQKKVIMDAVESADLLIFTTPTYCMRASGPMKSFIDLTFTYWMVHRPRSSMFSKRAVVVSTAAGAGAGSAVKDISTALSYWGIPYIKKLGFAVQAMGWDNVNSKKKEKIEKAANKLGKKLTASSGKKPFVGIKTRFLFNMMGLMQKGGMGSSPYEKEYWEKQGWFNGKRPWKQ